MTTPKIVLGEELVVPVYFGVPTKQGERDMGLREIHDDWTEPVSQVVIVVPQVWAKTLRDAAELFEQEAKKHYRPGAMSNMEEDGALWQGCNRRASDLRRLAEEIERPAEEGAFLAEIALLERRYGMSVHELL